MQTLSFDPSIGHFVVFSGGGGLVERGAEVDLAAGENLLRVRGVPASFDPETFLVKMEGEGVRLKEIVIRIPSRQYVEDNLKREGAAARKLIEASVDVGQRRKEIIEICEDIAQRTYLDEEVELTVWIVADAPARVHVGLSYFINDARFRWKPTITVEMGEGGEVRVRGSIAITNDSSHTLENVEILFADFARDFAEDAQNLRVPPAEMKQHMRNQILRKVMFK